jgi:aarF domain-containing kinase
LDWRPIWMKRDVKISFRGYLDQMLKNPKKVAFFLVIIGGIMFIIALRDILSPNSTIADLLPHFMKSILRVVRSFVTIALIIFDYKWSLWGITDEEERTKERKKVHKKSAERLLNLCLANGGVFIKAGQHIASLNQILPAEYTTTLQPCQDKAPTRPWSEIEELFIKEFGQGVDDYFLEFDPNPIAAASLAQVYKARLNDGSLVAVKVQYPNLEKQVENDTKIFSQLISIAEYFFKDLKLRWLLNEFERVIPHELDFLEEASNCERLSGMLSKKFKNSVICPKIYWDLTSKKILTMEFLEGIKVNDPIGLSQLNVNASQVAQLLSEVFCEQIFIHGFVHCDPHPGNIRVRKIIDSWNKGHIQLIILDHGLYQELDKSFRKDYASLWKAIVERDERTIRSVGEKLGIVNYELFTIMLTARSFDMSDIGMGGKLTPEEIRRLKKYGQDNFFLITQVLSDVNRKVLLLLKCNDLLRSVQMDLGVPVNYFVTFAQYAMKGINKIRLEENPSLWTYLICLKDYLVLNVKFKFFFYYRSLLSTWYAFCSAIRAYVGDVSQSEYRIHRQSIRV